MTRQRRGDRFAWARFNAYGVLLAGIAVLSFSDLLHPGDAELARLIGDVPPGQAAWTTGFIMAGILLLIGFIFGDRIAETAGLVLMAAGVAAQVTVAYYFLGLTDFTAIRVVLFALIGLCALARISVLWPKERLTIHIPARGETEDEQ